MHPLWQALDQLIQARLLLLVPDLLSPAACQTLLAKLAEYPAEAAAADAYQGESPRKTSLLQVPITLEQEAMSWFEPLSPQFKAHFGKVLTRHERPQFLRYSPGDHFRAHRDRSEAPVYRERALSLILFLNDHHSQPGFSGGRLSFLRQHPQQPELLQGVPLPPRQGMLAAFDPDLLHEVSAITAGLRYSLVTWLAE